MGWQYFQLDQNLCTVSLFLFAVYYSCCTEQFCRHQIPFQKNHTLLNTSLVNLVSIQPSLRKIFIKIRYDKAIVSTVSIIFPLLEFTIYLVGKDYFQFCDVCDVPVLNPVYEVYSKCPKCIKQKDP